MRAWSRSAPRRPRRRRTGHGRIRVKARTLLLPLLHLQLHHSSDSSQEHITYRKSPKYSVFNMKYDALTLASSSSSASSTCSSSRSFDDDFESITTNDKSNRSMFSLLAIVILAISTMILAHRCNDNHRDHADHVRPMVVDSSSSSSSLPDIAWLMSFPNSGTSYTMRLVQAVSNTTAATNYAEECKQDNSGHVATLYGSQSGPYLRQQVHDGGMSLPKKYILTKTHCGGRCVHCIPGETPCVQD